MDPRLATPPPLHSGSQGIAIYGDHPPALVDLDDLCPPQPSCPECADPRETRAHCREGRISLADLVGKLEIKPFGNETFPGLPNRTLGNFWIDYRTMLMYVLIRLCIICGGETSFP